MANLEYIIILVFLISTYNFKIQCQLIIPTPLNQNTPPIPGTTPVPPTKSGCGKNSLLDKRIVGGEDAIQHEFPWQVSMNWRVGITKGQHICGGSLISKKFVLTAAHCFENGINPMYYNITLGDHKSSIASGREQFHHIKSITLHPKYNPKTDDSDLALIEFDTEATINDYVNTICLPTFIDFELPGKVCTITGWGGTHLDKTKATQTLQKVDVPIISHGDCNHYRSYAGRVTGNMFCAGYPNGSADSCQGDSGGPLQCLSHKTNRWMLNGVTSWGDGCGTKHKYGVYVIVRHFLTWINKIVNASPLPTTTQKPKTPSIPGTPPIPNTPPIPGTPPNPNTPSIPGTPPTHGTTTNTALPRTSPKPSLTPTKRRRYGTFLPPGTKIPMSKKEFVLFWHTLRKQVIERLQKHGMLN